MRNIFCLRTISYRLFGVFDCKHSNWFIEPDNKAAVRYLAVDALNNSRTLNYYEKNGFAYLFRDEEQEAVSSRMKLPLKTRYMYFDLIEVIRK